MPNQRYSRQIITFGEEVMKKISNLKILIIGCDTIGTECAKCLSLMGVDSLYLYDKTIFSHKHRGRLIYKNVTPNKIKLDNLCGSFIKILNPDLNVNIVEKSDIMNFENYVKINHIDGVVNTIPKFQYLEKITVDLKIPYIFGYNTHFLGYAFVNFNNWIVNDIDGESVIEGYINEWEIVDKYLNLKISDIKKCLRFNKIKLHGNQTNQSMILDTFDSSILRDSVLNKSILIITINIEQFDKIAINNLKMFMNSNNNISIKEIKLEKKIIHDTKDEVMKKKTYQLMKLSNSFNKDDKLYDDYMDQLNNNTISQSSMDNIKFYPIGTMIGSILANEVMKITGKYIPLNQDILFDYRGLRSSNTFMTNNEQYYDVYKLLDKNLIKNIKKKSIFVVGCGALGCEITKNLSMLGFCSTTKAILSLTDMDTIDTSNLSRQFMYQEEDVNKLKSSVLKTKLNKYFPNVNVNNYTYQVYSETEDTFNTKFWERQDIVVNALDNVEARNYVNSRCTMFEKPLFESGTLGTKANTQPIIPYKTATYSDINDQESEEIPMCTLKNFPSQISHCVEWSHELYSKIIEDPINNCKALLSDFQNFKNKVDMIDNLELKNEKIHNTDSILNILISLIENNQCNAIKYTINLFKYYYVNPIISILNTYSENENFWIGNRIKPDLKLVKNQTLINFVDYFLKMVSVEFNLTNDITSNSIEEFVNSNNITAKYECQIDTNNLSHLINNKSKLNTILSCDIQHKYDKDNKLHLSIINTLSNLRADIYSLNNINDVEFSIISGRITPALTTTTSFISGLVIIDILKYLSGTNFKSTEANVNMGINTYTIYDTNRPKLYYDNMFDCEFNMKINTIPKDFCSWSRINVNCKEDLIFNMKDLVEFLRDQYTIIPEMITHKNTIIYNNNHKKNFLNITLKNLYSNLNIAYSELLPLDLNCYTETNMPVLTPILLLKLL